MKSSHSLFKAGDQKVTAQAWILPQVVQPRQGSSAVDPEERLGLQQTDRFALPFRSQVALLPGVVLPARDLQKRGLVKSREAGSGIRQWKPSEFPRSSPEPIPQTNLKAVEQKEEILEQARRQAQEIAEHASLQAAEFVEQAQAQVAAITQEAHQQGLNEGRQQAEEEALGVIQMANAMLDETRRFRQEVLAQSEPSVIDLVKNMAVTLFGNGIALEPAVLESAFQQAVAQAKTLGRLRIHLNPVDYDLLGPAWKTQQEASVGNPVDLIVDDMVQRGGCLIEGEYGTVDARVETKLSKVLETLSSISDQRETADL